MSRIVFDRAACALFKSIRRNAARSKREGTALRKTSQTYYKRDNRTSDSLQTLQEESRQSQSFNCEQTKRDSPSRGAAIIQLFSARGRRKETRKCKTRRRGDTAMRRKRKTVVYRVASSPCPRVSASPRLVLFRRSLAFVDGENLVYGGNVEGFKRTVGPLDFELVYFCGRAESEV